MKASRVGPAPLIPRVLQRRTFFFGMLAFLMLPFMPVQLTSILSAVVWIFAGTPYAIVFIFLGTFRLDSIPIYSGIDRILTLILPGFPIAVAEWITVAVMFSGNLVTAYIFKLLLKKKFTRRFATRARSLRL
jgi:hypothetical protein